MYGVQVLLERAVHAAMARGLKETRGRASVATSHTQGRTAVEDGGAATAAVDGGSVIEVNYQDLQSAFQGFVPPAFWGMQRSTALATQVGVGGLPRCNNRRVTAIFHSLGRRGIRCVVFPTLWLCVEGTAPGDRCCSVTQGK